MNKNTVKLLIALVCLGAAVAVIAYTQGWIGGSSGPATGPAPTDATGADGATNENEPQQGAGTLKKPDF